MRGFISWIRTSFEDDNGHASHRKLSIFFFCVLVGVMVIMTYVRNNPDLFPEMVWISIISGALGMSYLRGLQHIRTNSANDESAKNISNKPTGDDWGSFMQDGKDTQGYSEGERSCKCQDKGDRGYS